MDEQAVVTGQETSQTPSTGETTQSVESSGGTPDNSQGQTTNWEERYKELQSHSTRTAQEAAELRRKLEEMEISQPAQTPVELASLNLDDINEEELIEGKKLKQVLNNVMKTFQTQTQVNNLTMKFRTENPDMVEYEDMVGTFFAKTNPKLPADRRLNDAVKSCRTFLENERKKGAEQVLKKKTAAAEVSGLSSSTPPAAPPKAEKDETAEDYIAARKARHAKLSGLK